MGAYTGENPNIHAQEHDFAFKVVVESPELRHFSSAGWALSGSEIKNHGLAVKVGQVALAEAHFFDAMEEADFKIRHVRTLLPAAGAGRDCKYDCQNYDDGCRCCHTIFSKILLLSSCALLGCA